MPSSPTRRASIHNTTKFTHIETLSGDVRIAREDNGFNVYLPISSSVMERGAALLTALQHSRFIEPAEYETFFDGARIMKARKKWLTEMMAHGGYKTQRQAIRNFQWCNVEMLNGIIDIIPSKDDWTRNYNWLDPNLKISIDQNQGAAKIGSAIDLALSRCTPLPS